MRQFGAVTAPLGPAEHDPAAAFLRRRCHPIPHPSAAIMAARRGAGRQGAGVAGGGGAAMGSAGSAGGRGDRAGGLGGGVRAAWK